MSPRPAAPTPLPGSVSPRPKPIATRPPKPPVSEPVEPAAGEVISVELPHDVAAISEVVSVEADLATPTSAFTEASHQEVLRLTDTTSLAKSPGSTKKLEIPKRHSASNMRTPDGFNRKTSGNNSSLGYSPSRSAFNGNESDNSKSPKHSKRDRDWNAGPATKRSRRNSQVSRSPDQKPGGNGFLNARPPSRDGVSGDESDNKLLKSRERGWNTGRSVPPVSNPQRSDHNSKRRVGPGPSYSALNRARVPGDPASGLDKKSDRATRSSHVSARKRKVNDGDTLPMTADAISVPPKPLSTLGENPSTKPDSLPGISPAFTFRSTSGEAEALDPENTPPNVVIQSTVKGSLVTELPPPIPEEVLISRIMSTSEVVTHLVDHGCKDITDQLDLTSCSDYPVSNGGFGDVYKVNLRDGAQVAVKTMRVQVNSTSEGTKHLKEAARELHTWAKCDHPNVVKLLGLAKFRDQIGMVSMWMENGNLPSYLSRNPDADRCKIVRSVSHLAQIIHESSFFEQSTQICEGLAYLHSCDIVHGDLKGLNVLISDSGTPMLTDFGNAILRDRTLLFTATTVKASLSPRWTAPELLEGSSLYSMEADVYALGMTILETITGKVPYHGKTDHAVMFIVGFKQELPPRPEDVVPPYSAHSNNLWKLLVSCWSRRPNERPRAEEVADIIGTIQSHELLREQPPARGWEAIKSKIPTLP
ncbi:hypothetical protein FRC07_009442, partial [Ceratobasidium sp. 392]